MKSFATQLSELALRCKRSIDKALRDGEEIELFSEQEIEAEAHLDGLVLTLEDSHTNTAITAVYKKGGIVYLKGITTDICARVHENIEVVAYGDLPFLADVINANIKSKTKCVS